MGSQHIETLVIGAGQAGLSIAYHLRRGGAPCLVVDANERVGDNWRQQWDSLRLYTPAKYAGLPGMAFPADPWTFPGKEELADFLETYALHFDLPVRMSTPVHRLEARPGGGFTATLDNGILTCDNVVVATGTFGRTPNVPPFAGELDPSICQLHSSEYRRPSQLRDGPVLVVGASHSGCDIAYELAEGRRVVLAGRDCGQIPLRLESRAMRVAMPVMVLLARHVITRRTPIGRKAMQEIRSHGGPMLRVKREDLAARGVERTEARVTASQGGLPVLADGTVLDVANVVWATGFRQVFQDWLALDVLRDDGWPDEYRGIVAPVPGLYFCGLSFQYAFSSMLLPGIGRDAAHVAAQIARRSRRPEPVEVHAA